MLPQNPSIRPRVTRETRRLIVAAVVALAALWVLARVRFPDRPVNPSFVPPLLTQLTQSSRFADLASEISQARIRLDPMLAGVRFVDERGDIPHLAIRLRAELTLLLLPTPRQPAAGVELVRRDPASGLALARIAGETQSVPMTTWTPPQPDQPRYLMAAMRAGDTVALQPTLVTQFTVMAAAAWSGPVWRLPPDTTLPAGSFLFTSDGALAGLVVDVDGVRGLASADSVLADAEALLRQDDTGGGALGLEVQPLTTSLRAATGADAGALVSWVEPGSPAQTAIRIGDVIEAVDGLGLVGVEAWHASVTRLVPGETITLRIRRDGAVDEHVLTAVAPQGVEAGTLGLTMDRVAGIGARITAVSIRSPADRAGLRTGDVITLAGAMYAPTPAQVLAAYAVAPGERPLLLGISRGNEHRVVTVGR